MNPLLIFAVLGLSGSIAYGNAVDKTNDTIPNLITLGGLAIGGYLVYSQLKK